jgi:hypothetical protein
MTLAIIFAAWGVVACVVAFFVLKPRIRDDERHDPRMW